MNTLPTMNQLMPMMPELVLAIGAMVLLMIGVVAEKSTGRWSIALSTLLLFAVAVHRLHGAAGRHVLFDGSFVVDEFARFLKVLALLGAGGFDAAGARFPQGRDGSRNSNTAPLVVLSTLGMCVLISAADLIALYLGLELMSLALYVIAASDRDNVRSTEAGLKYFVLGALSSGMLLYGASLVYGFTGTVSFAGIAKAVGEGGIGLIFGLVFLFVGFCFKISAVPFHMWTPDVYEGAPTPVTAFFASATKVAAIAMFVRATIVAFPGIIQQWQQIIVFVAIASMVLGSFAAIGQRNLKRLMAYSSIGHMGFALVGLAAGTARRRAGRPDLHGDLCGDDARHLRRDPVDAPRRQTGRNHRGSCRGLPAPIRPGVLPGDADVLAGRHSAARRLLRQVLCVPRCDQCRALRAGGDRRRHQRGRRLLLSRDRQGDVFRRAAAALCAACRYTLRLVLAVCGLINILFFAYPAPLIGAATRRREIAVLDAREARTARGCGT